jgi:peptide methionine sulfoxide reductase MsrB
MAVVFSGNPIEAAARYCRLSSSLKVGQANEEN